MKTQRLLKTTLFAIAALASSIVFCSAQIYVMEVEVDGTGVSGSTTTIGYEDQIEIQSFNINYSSALDEANPSGPPFGRSIDFDLSMKIDRVAHPKLFKAALFNKPVKLRIRELTEVSAGVYQVDQEVEVEGYIQAYNQEGTSGDSCFVALSIWPEEIEITTSVFESDGSLFDTATDIWQRGNW